MDGTKVFILNKCFDHKHCGDTVRLPDADRKLQ